MKITALASVIQIVGALWQIFIEVETSLRTIYLPVLVVGIGIAALALFSKTRWLLWASFVVWPGTIIGELVFTGIALLTIGYDTTGLGRRCSDDHRHCRYIHWFQCRIDHRRSARRV